MDRGAYWANLSMRGRERFPGIPVVSQEEALSTRKERGTPGSSNKSYVPHQCIMYSRSAFSVFIDYIYTEFKEPLRATRMITKKPPAVSWAPPPALDPCSPRSAVVFW